MHFLPPSEIVGIFDACLHVAIAATTGGSGGDAHAHRHLLRSAAGDALSHCVIVVFGNTRRGGSAAKKKKTRTARRGWGFGEGGGGTGDDGDAKQPTHDDGDATEDSDDDWGERDPTAEDWKDGVSVVDNGSREKNEREKELPHAGDGKKTI